MCREREVTLAKENREHKSSVFADLFYYDESAKKNLLELHNALYGTQYSDPGVVDLIGLEDVLFRDLLYIAREYEKVIPARSRYKTGLIKIPTPRFLVFYNGVRNQPLEQTLCLSDAFMEQEEKPSLERWWYGSSISIPTSTTNCWKNAGC